MPELPAIVQHLRVNTKSNPEMVPTPVLKYAIVVVTSLVVVHSTPKPQNINKITTTALIDSQSFTAMSFV
jgi:hypothetical protein